MNCGPWVVSRGRTDKGSQASTGTVAATNTLSARLGQRWKGKRMEGTASDRLRGSNGGIETLHFTPNPYA